MKTMMRQSATSCDRSDVAELSPAAKAKLSIRIEQDGDADLREHLLGALGRSETACGAFESQYEVPSRWSIVHVLDRLVEAAKVAAARPGPTRPKEFGTAWPGYNPMTVSEAFVFERELLGDGGQPAVDDWHAELNQARRVRWQPSTAESTRGEEAEVWPMLFLGNLPHLAVAISMRAKLEAFNLNVRKQCQRLGLDQEQFNRDWQEGLNIITEELISRRVPVS